MDSTACQKQHLAENMSPDIPQPQFNQQPQFIYFAQKQDDCTFHQRNNQDFYTRVRSICTQRLSF